MMAYLPWSVASFLLLAAASNAFNTLSLPPKLQMLPRSTVAPSHTCKYPNFPLRPQQQQPRTPTGQYTAMTTPATFLRSAADDVENPAASDAESTTKLEKKIAGRKGRVDAGHRIAASMYSLITLTALVKYRSQPVAASFIAAGPGMASAVAFHLVGSGADDRVATGACKRLNLALAAFGFVGLLAKDIITTAQPLWIAACLVAMVNSIKGYGYGLKGWDLKMMEGNSEAVGDIVRGTLSSVPMLLDSPKLFSRSTGYAALAVTFGAMKCATVYEIALHVFSAEPTSKFVLTPLAFRYKKLLLLSVAAFTLKEAVDQKEVWPKGWGGAPVGLGLATSVATGAMAVHSISKGSLYLGGWIAGLAVFSAVDGINRWTSRNLPLKVSVKGGN